MQFWQEILSQVFFPILEDIDLAISNLESGNDLQEREFWHNTMQEIGLGFNEFFIRNINTLSDVIPIYCDVLVQFIAGTKNKSVNQKIFACFNNLISHVN